MSKMTGLGTEGGITLRAMTSADLADGLRLCRACHWNQVEDDWRCFLELKGAGCRLATRGGTVVGTVAFLRYSGVFSWIAMMLVDPETRLGGIGSRLLEAALDKLREEPCIRLDATPAGEPLYRRYGFTAEYPLARTKTLVTAERFGPKRNNVERMKPVELAEVFAPDRLVFGADRSALLASFFNRSPELAWVARDGATLTGYCFGRPGNLYSQLGPIVADDSLIARDLVSRSLCGQNGRQIAIDVPTHATEWIQWMESVGFEVERPFLRMCRGSNPSAGLPDRVFGIAGPEFG
jgi:GNAT superfamily N-acetyltransferase